MPENVAVERQVSLQVMSGASLAVVMCLVSLVVAGGLVVALRSGPSSSVKTAPSIGAAGAASAGRALPPPVRKAGADEVVAKRALSMVDITNVKVGYRLVFAPPQPGVRAQTDRATKTITVFAAPFDDPASLAHDVAHELGHAFDDRFLDDAGRRAYLKARGVPDAPWWPGAQVSDYGTGAGDFAEVFALCHASASTEFRSQLAPRPADACAALLTAGHGTGKDTGSDGR
ncbi:MAG TPA: hypothetical protein VFA94_07725 [Acidimicrobiales bacterium]|nr:hypothetical protein [Acidimicrobiales bacterium]